MIGNINSVSTTTSASFNVCKCCGGSGIQQNKKGINIICPCCKGSGIWNPPSLDVEITS